MFASKLTNTKTDFQTMKFPVFGIVRYRNKVLVSGGAGAKNVGIQDKLVRPFSPQMVFEESIPLSELIYEEVCDYNLQFMVVNEAVHTC